MKQTTSLKNIRIILVTLSLTVFQLNSLAQVTVYQYRHVPDEKIGEFVKRETTYWSKVAEKAVANKTMTFWALLEKVGGYDLPNSSNYLFINTFPDLDKTGDVFSNVESIAGVKMSDMETNSMSTVTSQFFLHTEGWTQDAKADPASDFNYVVMNYHNTAMPDSFIKLEKKYWHPFIESAMNKKQTKQLGWGNAVLLSPTGPDLKFSTVSYDLFATLQDALLTPWDPKTVFPIAGFNKLEKIKASESTRVVYRIVKVVSAP